MVISKKVLKSAVLLSTALVSLGSAEVIHQTTQWQSIGKETIATPGSSNNGVFWSLDNGATWSLLNNTTEFTVGQSVNFKVEIWKEFQGTHLSDVAKAWIDGAEVAKGEWALDANGNKKFYKGNYYSYYDGNVTDGSQSKGNPELLGSMLFSYTFSDAKEYEIVARTMCSDDLSKLNTNDGNPGMQITYITDGNQKATKFQNKPTAKDWAAFTVNNPANTLQGEIERYKIKVSDVPEPATLSLVGFGLLSMVFLRRKNRQ